MFRGSGPSFQDLQACARDQSSTGPKVRIDCSVFDVSVCFSEKVLKVRNFDVYNPTD